MNMNILINYHIFTLYNKSFNKCVNNMIRVADLQEWMYDNRVDVLKDGPLILMIIKKLNL
jgi:hypothetical protein